jgi:hypothetical protein
MRQKALPPLGGAGSASVEVGGRSARAHTSLTLKVVPGGKPMAATHAEKSTVQAGQLNAVSSGSTTAAAAAATSAASAIEAAAAAARL